MTGTDEARFTTAGLAAGALAALPVAAAAFLFGLVYGLVAGQHGLTVAETVLMSLVVFAGAAQLVAVELWADPVPIGLLVVSALTINLRHLLMGATLLPWLGRARPRVAYSSLFLLTDESWGLSIAELRRGGRDAGFLAGAGLCLYLAWAVSGALGRVFGALLPPLDAYGIDFVIPVFFVVLLAGFWRGRRDLLPWLAAAATALLVWRLVPGPWYILAGALAGSLLGAVRRA